MNKKQETIIENYAHDYRDVALNQYVLKNVLEKLSEEILKEQRKEIMNDLKKKVKDMPENFPELESDIYDIAYKEAKEYLLKLLK